MEEFGLDRDGLGGGKVGTRGWLRRRLQVRVLEASALGWLATERDFGKQRVGSGVTEWSERRSGGGRCRVRLRFIEANGITVRGFSQDFWETTASSAESAGFRGSTVRGAQQDIRDSSRTSTTYEVCGISVIRRATSVAFTAKAHARSWLFGCFVILWQ
ncbi:hypothetical protein KFK09_025087 [Dendrobium nobile]|uniref:Uncharacterized protein n=1 Tax=Dendrobium nobile TaxID=94219 RepID=A0A8T3AFX8_DENNO|nr:hypothetical protein KFK09_025087 [Dendrobium nobile]